MSQYYFRRRVPVIFFALILVVGMSNPIAADSTQDKAYFKTTQVVLDQNTNTFSVDLVLNTNTAYSGAEFGLQFEGDIEIKNITYCEQINSRLSYTVAEGNVNPIDPVKRNGTYYFGFISGENDFNDSMDICTIEFKYTGDKVAKINLVKCSTSIVDGMLASSKAITVGSTVDILRDTGNPKPHPNPHPNPGETTFNDSNLPLGVTVTFDDIQNSWAKNYIETLASRGIIHGISDTLFSPDTNIIRADFTKLLIDAMGVSELPETGFIDVSPTDYYYNEVMTAKALGIVNGYNNIFDPKSDITREDMMVIVYRALTYSKVDLSEKGDLSTFNDNASISSYARTSISALVGEGIIQGSNNMIRPKDPLTRAEASKVIFMIYDILHT